MIEDQIIKARNIFINHGNQIDSVFLTFPVACCGNSSDFLGLWLEDQGIEGLISVSGHRGEKTHAWLEIGTQIIDITIDQFKDGGSQFLINGKSTFHDSFSDQIRSRVTIASIFAHSYQKFAELMSHDRN